MICTDRAGLGAVADTVALLVSELVTNAVVHAETRCEVRIRTENGGVRVEVSDDSEVLPHAVENPDPLATSGRGLALVDALADASGAEPRPEGGKTMWFRVDAPGDGVGA